MDTDGQRFETFRTDFGCDDTAGEVFHGCIPFARRIGRGHRPNTHKRWVGRGNSELGESEMAEVDRYQFSS